ncbi:MAG: sulfur oxidation c-type cytochrome SoxX [Rhodospirillales bacterium]|nr:sulfur oxidation c-type cytochrome SoxX [Rhodospirillales bacterium]
MNIQINKTIATTIGAALIAAFAFSATANAAGADVGKIRVGDGVPKSLTGKAGDAKKGRATSIHRKKGNCLACHSLPAPEQADHGNLGPDLRGVGSRYSAAELRLRIIEAKAVNPDTVMPPFYSTRGLHRVQKQWLGKTLIGAQDVEDIVAYLLTLK